MAVAFGAIVVGSVMPVSFISKAFVCLAAAFVAIWLMRTEIIEIYHHKKKAKILPDCYVALLLLLLSLSELLSLGWQYASPPFVYLTPKLTAHDKLANGLLLWRESTGDFQDVHCWIYPRPESDEQNAAWVANYWSMQKENLGCRTPAAFVLKGNSELIGVQLEQKPGNYIVEIATRDGIFIESLTILQNHDGFSWVGEVTKDGRTFQFSSLPSGLSK